MGGVDCALELAHVLWTGAAALNFALDVNLERGTDRQTAGCRRGPGAVKVDATVVAAADAGQVEPHV